MEKNKCYEKIKFQLDRKSLEIIYQSFIRPILEYGDVLFDNCTQSDKKDLEQIQQEAARIITGTTKLVSIDKLMNEIGWESLEKRRHKHKLILFFKMKNNLTPHYLSDLVPPSIGSEHRYPLRNADDIQYIRTNTEFYYQSFLPSVIRDFNSLPPQTQTATTLTSFKRLLNTDMPKVPAHFLCGERKLQIFHTRLRTNCSSLSADLFDKNITDSSLCECGARENAYHYFLECPKYTNLRPELISTIYQFCNPSINVILTGSTTLPYDSNVSIFKSVQKYIRDTKRF